jgi:hypothetical protein
MIKRETEKIHFTEQMPSLLTNNETVKDSGTVANAFNNFFLAITESLNLHQVGREDAISFLKDAFPVKFPGIKIIPTTETEIKSIIHSLKSKNSSGYDKTTSKILKACSALIIHRHFPRPSQNVSSKTTVQER